MKTTPTAALGAILNMEPLHIHIESVARATCLRLNQSSLLIDTNYGHAVLWNRMVNESPSLSNRAFQLERTGRMEMLLRTIIHRYINLTCAVHWQDLTYLECTDWYCYKLRC